MEKTLDGVLLRSVDEYPGLWVSDTGRVAGPRGWRKPQLGKYGYLQVSCGNAQGKATQATVHRLVALAWVENRETGKTVDHKNGIKTDNRKDNLRWVCDHVQALNKSKTNSLRYRGVYQSTLSKRYKAMINVDNKQMYLGTFDTEEEAARAYDQALVAGGSPRINFV